MTIDAPPTAARTRTETLGQGAAPGDRPTAAAAAAAGRRARATAEARDARTSNIYYGAAGAVRDVDLDIPAERRHRVHRAVRLRQEHDPALLQPDERPHPGRPRRGQGPPRRRGHLWPPASSRSRSAGGSASSSSSPTRSRCRSTRTSPTARAATAMKDKKRARRDRRASLHRAALWDEVKDDYQKKSGLALSGGQQQRLCIARTLATEPERDPDGRAVLGPRPDRDAQDRGPDRRAPPSATRSSS